MGWFNKKETKSVGELGEEAAEKYLKNQGYKILARNYQNEIGRRLGEIDIIARDGKETVFVEVKTREAERYSRTLPEENITPAKLHKLNRIANQYLNSRKLWDRPYRFDAVSVWLDEEQNSAKIKHIKSIFY